MSTPQSAEISRATTTRRQVLTASAWSLPLVAATVAAPLAAATMVAPSNTSSVPTAQLDYTNVDVWKVTGTIPGHGLPQAPWWVNERQTLTGIAGNTTVDVPTYSTSTNEYGPVTVFVKAPASLASTSAPTVSGSGWSAGTPAVSGDSVIYSFIWAGRMNTTDHRYTPQLQFVLPMNGTPTSDIAFPFSVSVTAAATGAAPVTRNSSVN